MFNVYRNKDILKYVNFKILINYQKIEGLFLNSQYNMESLKYLRGIKNKIDFFIVNYYSTVSSLYIDIIRVNKSK